MSVFKVVCALNLSSVCSVWTVKGLQIENKTNEIVFFSKLCTIIWYPYVFILLITIVIIIMTGLFFFFWVVNCFCIWISWHNQFVTFVLMTQFDFVVLQNTILCEFFSIFNYSPHLIMIMSCPSHDIEIIHIRLIPMSPKTQSKSDSEW